MQHICIIWIPEIYEKRMELRINFVSLLSPLAMGTLKDMFILCNNLLGKCKYILIVSVKRLTAFCLEYQITQYCYNAVSSKRVLKKRDSCENWAVNSWYEKNKIPFKKDIYIYNLYINVHNKVGVGNYAAVNSIEN